MILTVTPNPAVDVTYEVDRLVPGAVQRVSRVVERAGGKGVNVARVLHALGADVTALVLAGGAGGVRLRDELAAEGVRTHVVDALPDVRRTLVVQAADGTTTSLWEPGHPPADPAAATRALLAAVRTALPGVRAVSVSGSLPPGVDPETPSRVAALAVAAGVPVVLDVDGDALLAAARAGHAALMPNRDELAVLAGHPADVADAREIAGELVARGVPLVVATLGADGLLAVSARGAVRARLPQSLRGNPTGAGDAACAAVVRALATVPPGSVVDLDHLARAATALSAAAVLRPVAGGVDPVDYRRLLDDVVVTAG